MSPASVPMRHWFDNDDETISSRSPPGGADAATHRSRGAGASPISQQESLLNSWRRRGMSGASSAAAVAASPTDPGCEDDEAEEESRRYVGRPGGIDGRPHTRSSSRNANNNNSNSRQSRNSRVTPGAGDRRGRGSGRVRRGGAVGLARSSSPVLVARGSGNGRNGEMESGAPSAVRSQLLAGLDAPSEAVSPTIDGFPPSASGAAAAAAAVARESSTPLQRDVVDERAVNSALSYVRDFTARMRDSRQQPAGDRGQQQGGRRTLSDFLREIEEIVRAQRAEVGGG